MLNELARSIRFDNASKGFDPLDGGVNRYILLSISELCEAQNEFRDGRGVSEIYYSDKVGLATVHYAPHEKGEALPGANLKPEGVPVEIADAIIRLLDIAGKFSHDLEAGQAEAVDFENCTVDDWLLGVVNIISDMFNYDPEHIDFWFALRQALGTLFLFCERHDIKIMDVVEEKLAYNRTRPPKHGRKF